MSSNIHIVVDYEEDFTVGVLGFEEAKGIDEYIANKIYEASRSGDKIVETKDCHSKKDYFKSIEGKRLPIYHGDPETTACSTYGKTGVALGKVGRIIIYKSSFGSMELANLLIKMDKEHRLLNNGVGIQKVIFYGVLLEKCVAANAIIARAVLPEAEVIVDIMGCESINKEIKKITIDFLENQFITVING